MLGLKPNICQDTLGTSVGGNVETKGCFCRGLRHDLMEEGWDTIFVMLALGVVVVQLIVGQPPGGLSDEIGQTGYDPLEGADADMTLYCSAATVLIVFGRFLLTNAKLCYYAVFKPNDEAIMEM